MDKAEQVVWGYFVMGREALAPVGSRWIRKDETKGRVFFVLTRKAFGQLEIMQEGRAIFCSTTQRSLLENWSRLPGKAELPSGFLACTGS